MAQKQRITSARRAAAPVGADLHDPVEAKALVSAHPDTMRHVPSSYERVAPEMGRRRCQIHFVVTASGRAPAPRCLAAQGADCCFSRSVFPFSKVLKQCRSQGLPDRKAGNSSSRHILAGIIAPAKAPCCPLAGRGTKAPGKRLPGRAQAFCWSRTCRSAGHRRAREGEPRVAFPGPARPWQKHYQRLNGRGHRPCHSATLVSGPAGGPKPPASARPAHGGRFAPAGSGAGLSFVPDLPVCGAPSRAGGGNAGRVS